MLPADVKLPPAVVNILPAFAFIASAVTIN